MRRSLILHTGAFLCIGLVGTAASVVVSAMALPGDYLGLPMDYSGPDAGPFRFSEGGAILASDTSPTICALIYSGWGTMRIEMSVDANVDSTSTLPVGFEHLPDWSRHESIFYDREGELVTGIYGLRTIDARGAPFLAAYAIVDYHIQPAASGYRVNGGWVYSGNKSSNSRGFLSGGLEEPRFIPLYPIVHGLILNVFFYGIGLYATGVCGWRLIRRRWRQSRGRCVRCSYRLVGLSSRRCPECGNNIC